MTDRSRNVGDVLTPGTRIEEFVIERELRSGGFGVTYLARDRSLGRVVAIKEYLPREWGTRRADGTVGPRSSSCAEDYQWGLTRFLDEARILARLDHVRIVRVYRVIEAWGTAYMVMEYVEGRNLDEVLETEGPWPEERVRALLEVLLPGLEMVHRAGLLHRDIKPANLMLRADGTPVLIDFGAARYAAGAHSHSLTSVLTPGYAPHEQYQRAGKQGPWTDVYSLGAVAYRALTGRAPAEATERVDAIARARPGQAPDPLPPVAAGRVSAAFGAAVTAALAVWPEDRPRDVAAWRALWDSGETAGSAVQPVFTGGAGSGINAEDRPGSRAPWMRWVAAGAAALVVAAGVAVGIIVNRGGDGNADTDTDGSSTTNQTVSGGSDSGGSDSGGSDSGGSDSGGSDSGGSGSGGSGSGGSGSGGSGSGGSGSGGSGSGGLVVDLPEQVERDLGLSRTAWRLLQTGLAHEGFDPGPADGQPGRGTRAAVRRWQEARGDAPTGYLTAESARVLREAGSAPPVTVDDDNDDTALVLSFPPMMDDDTALVLSVPAVGTLTHSDEVGVWTFFGNSGTDISVTVLAHFENPEVSLRSPTGEVIGTHAGGDGVAQLITNLPVSGRYHVGLRTTDEIGDYAVVVRIVRKLSLGTPATSNLNADVLGAGGGDTEAWKFDGTAGQYVHVDAGMVDGAPVVLRLRSPVGAPIGDGFGRLTAVLPQSGEYLIDVISFESGAYEIEVEGVDVADPPECTRQVSLAGGRTYERNDTLDGTCSTVHYPDGEHAVYYGFTLDQGASVVIEMTSGDVDSWLALRSGAPPGNDVALEENDDGGLGLDARIERFLDAGRYTIEATTLNAGETGDFTLTLTVGGVAYERTLAVGSAYSAAIDSAGDEDVYRIDVADPGVLTVYTTGSTDTFGELLDASGSVLQSNDDGDDLNFRLSTRVVANTYYVRVRHYDDEGAGRYQVAAELD